MGRQDGKNTDFQGKNLRSDLIERGTRVGSQGNRRPRSTAKMGNKGHKMTMQKQDACPAKSRKCD